MKDPEPKPVLPCLTPQSSLFGDDHNAFAFISFALHMETWSKLHGYEQSDYNKAKEDLEKWTEIHAELVMQSATLPMAPSFMSTNAMWR
jgi:hypothetical protein